MQLISSMDWNNSFLEDCRNSLASTKIEQLKWAEAQSRRISQHQHWRNENDITVLRIHTTQLPINKRKLPLMGCVRIATAVMALLLSVNVQDRPLQNSLRDPFNFLQQHQDLEMFFSIIQWGLDRLGELVWGAHSPKQYKTELSFYFEPAIRTAKFIACNRLGIFEGVAWSTWKIQKR